MKLTGNECYLINRLYVIEINNDNMKYWHFFAYFFKFILADKRFLDREYVQTDNYRVVPPDHIRKMSKLNSHWFLPKLSILFRRSYYMRMAETNYMAASEEFWRRQGFSNCLLAIIIKRNQSKFDVGNDFW